MYINESIDAKRIKNAIMTVETLIIRLFLSIPRVS